ncbi:hypothetical protein BDW66DRAFT_134460 [Aspergillus desertorum]
MRHQRSNKMGSGDDFSFFLYGVGQRPEALTLGSLVLENYWQPMIARRYTHELLRHVSEFFIPFFLVIASQPWLKLTACY